MAFDFTKVLERTQGGKGRGNTAMLLDFLETQVLIDTVEFGNYHVQTHAPIFIYNRYKKKVSPDTISRAWRKLREDYKLDRLNSDLHKAGLVVKEFKKEGFASKYFKIMLNGR